jgi:acyl-CoA synthetase (AMP-forming)/AMP-acid ligase II
MPTDPVTAKLPGDLPRLVRLCDYVRYHAEASPDREAIVFGATRLSYSVFDRCVDDCAAFLSGAGVKRGDRVAMLTTPRPEFAIVLMAAQRIGAIWVGLNPRYRLGEMDYILNDCKPAIFIAIARDADGRDYADEIRAIGETHKDLPIVTFGESAGRFFFEGKTAGDFTTHARATKDDPTVIVYTSGTTGRPKGALLAHRNLIYCYESVSRSFAGKETLRDGTRLLCNLPPNHIGCISEMLGNALIRGGTIVFAERFDPAAVLEIIPRERITLFGGVPVMLQMIFDHPDYAQADLSTVRMIGWGGAPVSRDLVCKMMATGAHLFTNYGLTEGGAVVSATPPNYTIDDLCDTVGIPDQSANHRLVAHDGREAEPGESGEIWLRGSGVFLGYWNNPSATALAIDEDGWLKTGDIAASRPGGAWTLKGRKMEMFKSGGFNVYPREIELALEQLSPVALAAIVAVSDPVYFEVGAAFVVAKTGHMLNADEVREHLRATLANYKMPKLVEIRTSLPMLPIGKVDKQALKGEAAALWNKARATSS